MAITMEQVIAALNLDEPDYAQAAKMGSAALPHLASLIQGTDPGLASKAASLVGMIQEAESVNVLEQAANHADPRVRIAAAAASRNLSDVDASRILLSLVSDADVGVQKVALQSVPDKATGELKSAINQLGTAVVKSEISDIVRQTRYRIQPTDKDQRSEKEGQMPSGNMNDFQDKNTMMPSGNMENFSAGKGAELRDMPSGAM
ncbi:MAG: HEAT repeat domain-containing protein [Leptolyngbyaceae cyanobacterium]